MSLARKRASIVLELYELLKFQNINQNCKCYTTPTSLFIFGLIINRSNLKIRNNICKCYLELVINIFIYDSQ